jgi:hypothetical protein
VPRTHSHSLGRCHHGQGIHGVVRCYYYHREARSEFKLKSEWALCELKLGDAPLATGGDCHLRYVLGFFRLELRFCADDPLQRVRLVLLITKLIWRLPLADVSQFVAVPLTKRADVCGQSHV